MRIRWKAGLTRLWVFLSILWIIAVIFILIDDLFPYISSSIHPKYPRFGDGPSIRFNSGAVLQFEPSDEDKLKSTIDGIEDPSTIEEEATRFIETRRSEIRLHSLSQVGVFFLLFATPPAVVFMFGACIFWIVRGFLAPP